METVKSTDTDDTMAREIIQAVRTFQPTALPVSVTIDHGARKVEIWAQGDLAPAIQRVNTVTKNYSVKVNSPPPKREYT